MSQPLFLGYGLCGKPLRTGGVCLLNEGHKTKHHTKCVYTCRHCQKVRRGRGPVCILCKEVGRQSRELKRFLR